MELIKLTEKRVQNIKASELAELWPKLTELESFTLAKAVRNDLKLEPSVYYSLLGKTIESIIIALQERAHE